MSDILQLVRHAIRRIPASHGIAVALSGGADSVALAVAMAEAVALEREPRRLLLLHCNFHLRGSESDRDAAVARDIADRLSLPFRSVDFNDVCACAATTGESIEMICRRLRYEWFDEVLSQQQQPTWLALGHHIEDNRETLLLNLFRGTGTRGLRGMEEIDSERRFMRPLLRSSRSDIEEFLAARGLPWIVDSSNLIADVKRNRLRLNIIPAISAEFPDAMHGLDSTASNLADDYAILQQALNKTIAEIRLDTPGTYDLSRLATASAAPRRVIFEIVRAVGFNAAQAAGMAAAATSTEAKIFRSHTHTATVHHGILTIDTLGNHDEIMIEADNPFALAGLSGEFSCKIINTGNPLETIERLISEKIPFYAMDATSPLPRHWTWRQPAVGDRIAPYGMKGRTRLVSDILSDAHASPAQKRRARLLVAEGTPVWLAPWRASGFRQVTRDTTEILLFRLT